MSGDTLYKLNQGSSVCEVSESSQSLKSKTGDYFKSFDTITEKIPGDTHESQFIKQPNPNFCPKRLDYEIRMKKK